MVWNRSPRRTAPLLKLGALHADSASDALRRSKLAIIALPNAESVRELLLSDATAPSLKDCDLLNISYTTVAEIQRLEADVRGHGGRLSEVNVTVYPDSVRRRKGHFNLAAAPDARAVWLRVLSRLGSHVHDVGHVGNASRAETALWLSFMLAPAAIAYATTAFERYGLPSAALVSALTENPTLRMAGAEELIPQILGSEYRTDTYSVENFRESAETVAIEAERLGFPTGIFAAVQELFARAESLGHAKDDVAAVAEAIREQLPPS